VSAKIRGRSDSRFLHRLLDAVAAGGGLSMRLSILLFLLKLKLLWALKWHSAFKKRAAKRDYTIVIRTADGRHGRYFAFAEGKVFSRVGRPSEPTVEMVWSDVATAFRALASGDKKAVVQALGRSDLKIEGNLEYFFWFGEMMDLLAE
jgi:hypothetical protein